MADESDQPQGSNIAGVINKKLTESIQNMDLINVLQKMVAVKPEDEESEEIREKLKGVVEQYSHLSDTEKEQLTKQIKDGLVNRLNDKLKDPSSINLGGIEDAIREAVMFKLYLVAAGVLLLIFIIVFFGYKLYKSIKEKEKKREEKKKAKQMKKKK